MKLKYVNTIVQAFQSGRCTSLLNQYSTLCFNLENEHYGAWCGSVLVFTQQDYQAEQKEQTETKER